MIKQYTRYAVTIILSLWITMAVAHSQVAPSIGSDTSASSLGTPQLRALTVGLENGLSNLEILDANKQPVGKLTLRKLGFSTPFSCPIVEGKLNFGVQDGVDENEVPVYKVVASVNWKQSYRQICLIFVPMSLSGKSGGAMQYGISAMDMSTSSFKMGHSKVLNFTPFNTMVRMGEHKSPVKAWGNSVFSEIDEVTDLNMAQIEVYYVLDETVYTAHQTRFRYLDRIRYLTLIYPDIKNKRIAVSMVKDYGKLY